VPCSARCACVGCENGKPPAQVPYLSREPKFEA
jgi:hypothetical protein